MSPARVLARLVSADSTHYIYWTSTFDWCRPVVVPAYQ